MDPHGFSNLGAVDKPADPRDIKLGAAAPTTYTHPPTLTNDRAWAVPVEYQGQQPACGAHAGAETKDLLLASRFSPRFTWGDLKTFDGLPIDAGTDIRSIFKSITKAGVLDFSLLGNEVGLSFVEYAKAPTPEMRAQAGKHSGMGYGFIQDCSFEGIKQFISDHGPTIILLRVGKEWWTSQSGVASWAEKDILPLRTPAAVVSGHFVVAHSYDEKYIYFLNHWSDSWGRKGHGYFGSEYVPFINDAGALFPLLFAKDLQFGMTDPDVLRLQQTLNKNPKTQVAAQGPGSPGQETSYFGALTKAAVQKYQALKGIQTTGYVGPLTRATLNSA